MLVEIKEAVEGARASARTPLTEQEREEFFGRYDESVWRGLELNPERHARCRQRKQGATAKKVRGRIGRSEARKQGLRCWVPSKGFSEAGG